MMPFAAALFGARGKIDPYWDQVVSLHGFPGTNGQTTTVDESRFAHPTTLNSNTQVSTAQSVFGGTSALFDGNNDWLSTFNYAEYNIGSQEFPMEVWVRPNAIGAQQCIADKYAPSASASNWQWMLSILASGLVEFRYWDAAGNARVTTTSTPISAGAWTNIMVDRDSTGKLRIYLNGTMRGSNTWTGADANFRSSTVAFIIGTTVNGTLDFAGYMDEWRWTIGKARYASDAGFTVPTAPFPRG